MLNAACAPCSVCLHCSLAFLSRLRSFAPSPHSLPPMSRSTTVLQYKIDNISPSASFSGAAASRSAHSNSPSLSSYSRSSKYEPAYDHYDYLCKLLVIGDSGCGLQNNTLRETKHAMAVGR